MGQNGEGIGRMGGERQGGGRIAPGREWDCSAHQILRALLGLIHCMVQCGFAPATELAQVKAVP